MAKSNRVFWKSKFAILLSALIGAQGAGFSADKSYLYFKLYSHGLEDLADRYVGFVAVDPAKPLPGSPHTLRYAKVQGDLGTLGMEKLTKILKERNIGGVDFSAQPQFQNADLAALRSAHDLRFLSLLQTHVSDAGLVDVATLTTLQTLWLPAGITDEGLVHLAPLSHLRELRLRDTAIRDKGLAVLKNFPDLESLDLRGTKVTDASLQVLKGLPLRVLALSPQITDKGLDVIKSIKTLRQLDLSETQTTDAGLVDLNKLRALHTLFASPRTTSAGLLEFAEIKTLRRLDLTGTQIGETSMGVLSTLSHLEELALSDTDVGDDAITRLRKLKDLRVIEMSGTQITPAGWAELSYLKSLEIVSISWHKGVPRSDLRRLVSLPKLRILILNGTPYSRERINQMKEIIFAPSQKKDQETYSSRAVLASNPGMRRLYLSQEVSDLEPVPQDYRFTQVL